MNISRRNLQRCILSFVGLILFLDTAQSEVVCPGTYGGHLQGIATDEAKAIYWSFTTSLVKTDAEGNLLAEVSVPSHHGDLTVQDGKVYVAVNLGEFNEEAGQAISWVFVFDAEKLTLLSKHRISEVVHGAGGMDYKDGHFFVVGGLPTGHEANYVYEYDKHFRFLKKYTIESGYTLMGIQTACYWQGYWWFGCYGKTRTLLKTDAVFQLVGKYDFDCALGISGVSEDTFLIGRALGSKPHRGQILLAGMNPDEGLVITEAKAE
jgi:hypothetical protein